MDFRIADTFVDSLTLLTDHEQKAVKMTAFDLRLNPANPGMSVDRLNKTKGKNLWMVRWRYPPDRAQERDAHRGEKMTVPFSVSLLSRC